jgi:hypothetical protein
MRNVAAACGPTCVKNQKRSPELSREHEQLTGNVRGLLTRLLVAHGPPAISQATFEQDLCPLKLEEFSHGLGRERQFA